MCTIADAAMHLVLPFYDTIPRDLTRWLCTYIVHIFHSLSAESNMYRLGLALSIIGLTRQDLSAIQVS
jgi:hypothetical protein